MSAPLARLASNADLTAAYRSWTKPCTGSPTMPPNVGDRSGCSVGVSAWSGRVVGLAVCRSSRRSAILG